MPKPQPDPLTPDELPQLARSVMAEDKFPFLATMDGDQPRVRPVSPVRTDGFIVYVANLRTYHKTLEIQANPKIELCYLASNHDQVRLTGMAQEVSERSVILDIWETNPLLRQYLGSPDNPEFILYRITPHRLRFMREWALSYHEVPLEP